MKTQSKTCLLALVSLLVTAIPSQAADVLLLSDNFNTGNNTNLNIDLATRQDGTLESTGGAAPAGSTWTKSQGSTNAILNNQLNVTNGASVSHVVNNADFEASLTSVDLTAVSGFIVAFKFAYTGQAGQWSSAYLSTHNAADERANSRFGFVGFASGSLQFYGGAVSGSQVPTGVSNETLGSLIPGWSIANQNSYSLRATRTTATTGTYDAFVNGVEVASDIPYAFGTGGSNGEVNFEIINIGNGAGLYDDFSITTVGGGPTGFAAWQEANNTTGGIDEDHDNDGVGNGIEYFLVGPAPSSGFTALPAITPAGSTFSITWPKADGYEGVYTTDFVVETSTTLEEPWDTETPGVNVTLSGNNVTYTFPEPLDSKRFARLKVTGP